MNTEAEKQLAALVGMRTLSHDKNTNNKAIEYIKQYLSDRGMFCTIKTYNGRDNLIASTKPYNGFTPKVLLGGHLDVVDGSDEVFKLRLKDGKLIGRGVYDMKFSIAGYMQVVNDLQGELGKYDFSIMVTSDEEIGGEEGVGPLMKDGLLPKVCILPDSTAPNWDIEVTTKGMYRIELIFKGKSSHGSRPWEGDSASVKLLHALTQIESWFVGQNVTTNSFNVGVLSAGTSINQTPDTAVAGIDIRYLTKQDFAQISEKLKDICKKYNATIKPDVVAGPVVTDLNHEFVAPYIKSVTKITGRKPEPFTSCAASDAPFFAEKDVQCIVSCPKGGGHHGESEWIEQESFLHFVPILKDYLNNVARI